MQESQNNKEEYLVFNVQMTWMDENHLNVIGVAPCIVRRLVS
jgi:hypothetical protein